LGEFERWQTLHVTNLQDASSYRKRLIIALPKHGQPGSQAQASLDNFASMDKVIASPCMAAKSFAMWIPLSLQNRPV